ncbi:class I SAM-dependent methyltransferase [Mycolicibacterium palauense]|uniref:class I SAM-dependent methyltransferase n=1 Tax=Mycolicibacterium palauense TaxID=2034511 RepID=UPI000BFEEE65|nr:class I SAM-dependent methyltransferase [Mycolicibacterium palauense]
MSETTDARQLWNERYGESHRVWSGRANARLVEMADGLAPGRALDLGCGEGGDARWLAERGWQVVAVDISDAALQRAAEDAGDLAARIDFQHHDLTESFPEGTFDLVSAQFLHSPVSMDRAAVLRRAADAVAPGGVLLIVDHGAAPPWAEGLKKHVHDFPSPQEVVDGLGLDGQRWERVRVDSAEREGVLGPDGQEATLLDNIIMLRRRD